MYIACYDLDLVVGGENIKEINRASGAHAELIRENNNDPNVKRFRIQGTPDQIQSCIQLINEKAGLVSINQLCNV